MSLPKGWEEKELQEVCEIVMGQSPSSTSYNETKEGLPFFQGKAEFGIRYPIAQKWCNVPIKIAEQNDILLSVRAPVGAINIANSKCCIGRGLSALRPKKYLEYLFLFFILKMKEQDISKLGQGSTFKAITGSKLKKIKIPVPPVPTQQKIVAILEKAEAIKQKRKQIEELTNKLLQSIFIEMFGDPETNPKGWGVQVLSKHIKIISGNYFKPSEFTKKGVRLFKINNAGYGEADWSEVEYLPKEYINQFSDLVLKEGDIVLALNRPITNNKVKVCKLGKKDFPSILYQRVGKFNFLSDELLNSYLYGFFISDYFRHLLETKLTGSDQPYINVSALEKISIPLPSSDLQQKFAQIVEKVEAMKQRQLENAKTSEELFDSLMHRAFRGELVS